MSRFRVFAGSELPLPDQAPVLVAEQELLGVPIQVILGEDVVALDLAPIIAKAIGAKQPTTFVHVHGNNGKIMSWLTNG